MIKSNYFCLFPCQNAGFVRLRCVDKMEGTMRSNTYEDIYRTMKPADEDEPDPVLDRRPIQRRPSMDMQNGDEVPSANYMQQRRLSGVLPAGYNINLNAQLKSVNEDIKILKKTNGISKITDNSLNNKKKVFQNPRMPAIARPNINNPAFDSVKASLAKIEEPEEEDWHESLPNAVNTLPSIIVDNEGSLSSTDSDNKSSEWSASIRNDCFLNKRLKVRSVKDVYNLSESNESSEKRTYLSSERYRATFEDEFEDFLKVVRKQDLLEFTDVEEPAKVIAHVNENQVSFCWKQNKWMMEVAKILKAW